MPKVVADALAKKYEAEAELAKSRIARNAIESAQTELFIGQQRKRFDMEADSFAMDLETKRETYKEWQVRDSAEKVYRFTTEVNDKSATECISTLTRWSRLHPEAPMTIIFTSPGGSVVAGMALFDFLTELREKG